MSIKVYPGANLDVYPPINSYEAGSFTVTATGFSGTAPSGTARYVRIGRQVIISIPLASGTSNSTALVLGTLPASLAPPILTQAVFQSFDNGAYQPNAGLAQVSALGTAITLFKDCAGNSWTATGNKGWGNITLVYFL